MTYARITGTGGYLPENVMTNHDLEKIVDTSDQWIRERTGIEQRHIAAEGQTIQGFRALPFVAPLYINVHIAERRPCGPGSRR